MGDKTFGGVHQLFEVFHPVGAFAVGAVVLHQATVFKHEFDDFTQAEVLRLFAHHVQFGHKRADIGAGFAFERGNRVVQRAALGLRHILQLFERACANAARRKVDDAHEAGVVVRVLQHAQVGQCVLDFGTLKKPQAAIDLVGHGGVEERRFYHAALGVGAVQHGHFGSRHILPDELLDFIHHPLRFGEIAG